MRISCGMRYVVYGFNVFLKKKRATGVGPFSSCTKCVPRYGEAPSNIAFGWISDTAVNITTLFFFFCTTLPISYSQFGSRHSFAYA